MANYLKWKDKFTNRISIIVKVYKQNKQLIGSLKKKELEYKHTQVFLLANTNLLLLDSLTFINFRKSIN